MAHTYELERVLYDAAKTRKPPSLEVVQKILALDRGAAAQPCNNCRPLDSHAFAPGDPVRLRPGLDVAGGLRAGELALVVADPAKVPVRTETFAVGVAAAAAAAGDLSHPTKPFGDGATNPFALKPGAALSFSAFSSGNAFASKDRAPGNPDRPPASVDRPPAHTVSHLGQVSLQRQRDATPLHGPFTASDLVHAFSEDWLPLHAAASLGLPAKTLSAILEAHTLAATTCDAHGRSPFRLLPCDASEEAAVLLFDASTTAPRQLWNALDPATGVSSSAELRAALTANREAAATRFTAADWTLSLASIVRLRPGLGDRKGLRAGQLGIVVRIDRDGNTTLRRWSDDDELGVFHPSELVHGFRDWLPLHAAAALGLPAITLSAVLQAHTGAATTPDDDDKLPYQLVTSSSTDEAATLLFEASGAAPRPLWEALYPATAAVSSAELRGAITTDPTVAAHPFVASESWVLAWASLVRLRPGLDHKKGLRAGELAIVTHIDRDGDVKLKRHCDGQALWGVFSQEDLVHGFDKWLPLHAAAALALPPAALAIVLEAYRPAATMSDESSKLPYELLPPNATDDAASLLFDASGTAPRQVWEALDPTTALASSAELRAALRTEKGAQHVCAPPTGWVPSVGALVRLRRGPEENRLATGERKGLAMGELAMIEQIDRDGDAKLKRQRDGLELPACFLMNELQHGFSCWLPLHAAAALGLPASALSAILQAHTGAATTPDDDDKLPYQLVTSSSTDEAATLLFEASGAAPRPLWEALYPATAAVSSAELRGAITTDPTVAAHPFVASESWVLAWASLVRLRPGLDHKKGLRAGELAIVTHIDRDGDVKLKRHCDGQALWGVFSQEDLVHGFDKWLPLHAAAALALPPAALAIVLEAYRPAATMSDESSKLPYELLPFNSADEVATLLYDARTVPARSVWEALDVSTVAVISSELQAGLDLQDLARPFSTPAGWVAGKGSVVRLRPELRGGDSRAQDASIVAEMDSSGGFKLKRKPDDTELSGPFNSADLVHGFEGSLPLHAAAMLALPAPVITILLDAYQPAAAQLDLVGSLPLALALSHSYTTDDVVMRLAESAPSATGADGRTPLHLASAAARSTDLLQKLLSAFPAWATEIDNEGKNAFQLLPFGVSEATVSLLCEACGPRPLWETLDPSTATASPAEVCAVLEADPSRAAQTFVTPDAWSPTVGSLVRLQPGLEETHSLGFAMARVGKVVGEQFFLCRQDGESQVPQAPAARRKWRLNAPGLHIPQWNIRARPDTSSEVLRQVGDGAEVEAIAVKDGWLELVQGFSLVSSFPHGRWEPCEEESRRTETSAPAALDGEGLASGCFHFLDKTLHHFTSRDGEDAQKVRETSSTASAAVRASATPFISLDLVHGFEGLLPLHAAVALMLPEEIVFTLLKAHPRAAAQPDPSGSLPLALALSHSDTADSVVLRLAEAAPSATGSDGRTPLHLASAAARSTELLQQMLSMFPAWATEIDNEGKNAFQLLPFGVSEATVSLLCKACGPRPLWETLDPSTATASPAEICAALEVDPSGAAQTFVTPNAWSPTVGSLVRLRPGMRGRKGLGPGELATIVEVGRVVPAASIDPVIVEAKEKTAMITTKSRSGWARNVAFEIKNLTSKTSITIRAISGTSEESGESAKVTVRARSGSITPNHGCSESGWDVVGEGSFRCSPGHHLSRVAVSPVTIMPGQTKGFCVSSKERFHNTPHDELAAFDTRVKMLGRGWNDTAWPGSAFKGQITLSGSIEYSYAEEEGAGDDSADSLRVVDCGNMTKCVGLFTRRGDCNGKPFYMNEQGAIIFHKLKWKMNSNDNKGGWYYSVRQYPGSESLKVPPQTGSLWESCAGATGHPVFASASSPEARNIEPVALKVCSRRALRLLIVFSRVSALSRTG